MALQQQLLQLLQQQQEEQQQHQDRAAQVLAMAFDAKTPTQQDEAAKATVVFIEQVKLCVDRAGRVDRAGQI